MSLWPDILFKICAVCAPLVCYRLGKMATRGEADDTLAALVELSMKAGRQKREICDRDALIEQMKRSGRRKRDECRKLKKQASLMQFVAKETAESNAIIFSRMIALRNALGEIYVQCSKNTWQQKRIRHILKKHGVKSHV